MNARRIARELALLTLFQIWEPTKTLDQVSEDELYEQTVQLLYSEAKESLNIAREELEAANEHADKSDSDDILRAQENLSASISHTQRSINIVSNTLEWASINIMSVLTTSRKYALELIKDFRANKEKIDEIINSALDKWTIDRLHSIDLNIMRIGVLELIYKELEPKIVIDEAVEIAKKYGDDESYKFINAILKKIMNLNINQKKQLK